MSGHCAKSPYSLPLFKTVSTGFLTVSPASACVACCMAPMMEAQDPEDTASSGGEGRQTPAARLKPGGPCCICGATYSSTWYGKKNGKKFCRGNPCKKAGGYSVGKRKKRCGAGDDDDDVGDFSENIYKISGVEACLGFRRAATALACLARRSSY